MKIPTVTLTHPREGRVIVNVADAPAWKKRGYRGDDDAPEDRAALRHTLLRHTGSQIRAAPAPEGNTEQPGADR